MWDNLQEQFNKLISSIPLRVASQEQSLSLLDIGCGTGLSTEMMLRTALGSKITSISLLDTSPNMLEKAKKRIQKWKKPITLFNTEIENINEKFDIIIVCSVIHHIPDLKSFFNSIENNLILVGY
jgi:2-polyprenyl-3-methyl-5-hydroxy-6-metoxy-1,4-benzoquinol methylase